MLQSTISIVYISMEDDCSILKLMSELDWHGFLWSIENTWIIDIIPGVEKMVSPIELWEQRSPELLRILIQEIHEG